jgi:iron complex outermembrane receptor protein
MKTKYLLSAAAIAAFAHAGVAQAASSSSDELASDAITQTGTDQSRPLSEDNGANAASEIVVTAQRRAERLVDVPISVDSFSQDELELKKIDTVMDLVKVTTSLRFEGNPPAFQPTLRGIGSQVQGAGVDSNVPVYVDGFYLANNYGMNFNLPNVSNIQVLKGPQGTLFGRNATAGAILVTTSEPSDRLTGRVKLTYAKYDDIRAQAYLSGPLNDNVRAGASIYFRKSDGWTKSLVTGADDVGRLKSFNIRPDILFTNNDNLKFRLVYEHAYNFDTTTLVGVYPDSYNLIDALGTFAGRRIGEYGGNVTPENINKSDGIYGMGEWIISDAITLHSATSYRTDSNFFHVDGDGMAIDYIDIENIYTNKTFSQEFTLNGKTGRLDWVAGVNYYWNRGTEPGANVTAGGVLNVLKNQSTRTNAGAAFADLTYEAVDGLFLTVGGRYSVERKFTREFPGGQPPERFIRQKWNKFTPRAVARYEIEPNTNVYASFSKGFKSGAYTGFPPSAIDPETVTAYEAGFKHASPLFSLNASTFLYNYKDAQVSVVLANGLGKTLNAGRQRNYGAELEATLNPISAWRIGLSAAYLNAKYTSFPEGTSFVMNGAGGWQQIPFDASGTAAPRSPKWSGNVSTSYDVELGSGTLQLAGNLSFFSKFYRLPSEIPALRQPGYAKVDLNLSYTTDDERIRAELFVTNLTNYRNITSGGPGTFGTYQFYDAPRVFGASIGYSF